MDQLESEVASTRQEIVRVSQVSFEEFRSGPLPEAKELNAYDPDTRAIIVNMAVKEQEHTHRMDRWDVLLSLLGMFCGYTISLAGILGGVYLIVNGHSIAGTLFGTAFLTVLVAIFVKRRATSPRSDDPRLRRP